MTAFRLIRRSLFCFIVGVVAFGASGWLLRPRPNWSVMLERDDGIRLLQHQPNTDGAEPIWVVRPTQEAPFVARAFDPANGRVLHTIAPVGEFEDYAFRWIAGRVAVTAWKSDEHDLSGPTRIMLFDAQAGTPNLSRSFDGHAEVFDDGRTVWCAKSEGGGLHFEIVELESGRILHRLEFAKGFKKAKSYDFSVSPNGKLLAMPNPIKSAAASGATIDLWDVEKQSLTKKLTPPRANGKRAVEIQSVKFSDDGRELEYQATAHDPGHHGQWRWVRQTYDLVTDQHRNAEFDHARDPSLPSDFSDNCSWSKTDDAAGEELWTALDDDTRRGVFGVFRSGEPVIPWTRVPFPLQFGPLVSFAIADQSRSDNAPRSQRRRFFVHCWKAALRESIPEGLQPYVPATLKIDDNPECLYWYDADRNAWRDVGIIESFSSHCLRADSLVTLGTTNDDRNVLRSWPLPPRDPRFPAAAIAVVSAVAVWWLCAKRAVKRKKRVAT